MPPNYSKIYADVLATNSKLLTKKTRLDALQATIDALLRAYPSLRNQSVLDYPKIEDCTDGPFFAYLNFLKDLLSPTGDLGSAQIFGTMGNELIQKQSAMGDNIDELISLIKQLISFYDPIENQAIVMEYYWFPLIRPVQLALNQPSIDKESLVQYISPSMKLEAFNNLLKNSNIMSSRTSVPTYFNQPERIHRFKLLADIIGLNLTKLKTNQISEMVQECKTQLGSFSEQQLANLEDAAHLWATKNDLATLREYENAYATNYGHTPRKAFAYQSSFGKKIISSVVPFGLATASILCIYHFSKKGE